MHIQPSEKKTFFIPWQPYYEQSSIFQILSLMFGFSHFLEFRLFIKSEGFGDSHFYVIIILFVWLHTQPLQHVAELTCFRLRHEKWARKWISKLMQVKNGSSTVSESCLSCKVDKNSCTARFPRNIKAPSAPFITIPAALQGCPRTLLRGQRQPEKKKTKNIAIKGRLIIALLGTSLAQESAEIKGVQRLWRTSAASRSLLAVPGDL